MYEAYEARLGALNASLNDARDEVSRQEAVIAGLTSERDAQFNKKRNVLGMMPHPERASEVILGSEDGLYIFKSLIGTS